MVLDLIKIIHRKVIRNFFIKLKRKTYLSNNTILDSVCVILCFILSNFSVGVALAPLGGITNALREKARLTGTNEQNRKQYQEYQNTIASQNAGKTKIIIVRWCNRFFDVLKPNSDVKAVGAIIQPDYFCSRP